MATGNKVPERLINFRVYNDGNDLLGVANVDLPSIEAMSDTVSGAGNTVGAKRNKSGLSDL